jgi:hypothetical protein
MKVCCVVDLSVAWKVVSTEPVRVENSVEMLDIYLVALLVYELVDLLAALKELE